MFALNESDFMAWARTRDTRNDGVLLSVLTLGGNNPNIILLDNLAPGCDFQSSLLPSIHVSIFVSILTTDGILRIP